MQPPLALNHVLTEEKLAKKEGRTPKSIYDITLTNSLHSTCPRYRLLQSFGSQNYDDPVLQDLDAIPVDHEQGSLKCSSEQLTADAARWAEAFAKDAYQLHVLNHDHSCTQTCGRNKVTDANAKNKANKRNKQGACRFGFDHIIELVLTQKRRKVRRPGKTLVSEPYVMNTEDAKDHGKIALKRTHPFRSSSSDVSQVLARSNVDVQYVPRLPILTKDVQSPLEKNVADLPKPKWVAMVFRSVKTALAESILYSILCAFRAAHCADFYITKYSSKSLQTFAPLLLQLQVAMQKLKNDEESEILQRQTAVVDKDLPPTKSKTDSWQRARRVLLRMCYAANRSVWLSCAELYVIVSTGAAGWQTHHEKALFLPRSIYMAKACKRMLESKTEQTENNATISLDMLAATPAEISGEIEEQTFAETASLQDDYLHRGPALKDMSLWVYSMHIYRVPRNKLIAQNADTFFFFEPHYALFHRYAQRMHLYAAVPRLIGPTIPTEDQDEEMNALIKSLLFEPLSCKCSQTCASPEIFRQLFAKTTTKKNEWSCAKAWRGKRTRIEHLAEKARTKDAAAIKQHSILDCIEFRTWLPDHEEQQSLKACALRTVVREIVVALLPAQCLDVVASFLCCCHTCILLDSGASEHCNDPEHKLACVSLHAGRRINQPFLSEYCARLAKKVSTNMDLTAEARTKPRQPGVSKDSVLTDSDLDADDDKDPDVFLGNHPNMDEDDVNDAFDDSDLVDIKPKFPISAGTNASNIAFRMDTINAALTAKKRSVMQQNICSCFETFKPLFEQSYALPQDCVDTPGLCFRSDFAEALCSQKAWIHKQKHDTAEPDFMDTQGEHPLQHDDLEPSIIQMPPDTNPATYAWELLVTNTASQDQIDFLALLTLPMENMWHEKPLGQNSLTGLQLNQVCRIVGLGGGGCGKSWLLNRMIAPLIGRFFSGQNAYVPLCATNAGARHINGRTLHTACGLNASSSMKTSALQLSHDTRKKMQTFYENTSCLAIDEISQVAAPLLHALSLRCSLAREISHKLQLQDYLKNTQTFGACFAVLLLGDFLQLPPVPESASLLHPVRYTSYEQQQARALMATFDYVFEFTSAKRFSDPYLKEILHSMRNGCPISDAAWEALKKTRVLPNDPRLNSCPDHYECAYSWEIVAMAQQLRAKQSAKRCKQILYYIQAVDKPSRSCSEKEHSLLLQTASLSDTQKLMGLLPLHKHQRVRLTKKVSAPQLVQEREGHICGIEFRSEDLHWTDEERQKTLECGHYICKALPLAVYVKIDDFNEEILPGQPGVVAIVPNSAKFQATIKKEKISVQRHQIPLAPAQVKTIHSMQGSTADPGLVAHWNLPPQLGEASAWLSHYVLLSRVRSLQCLLSLSLPNRKQLESGPPDDLKQRLHEMFHSKIQTTHQAAKEARQKLGWPERT